MKAGCQLQAVSLDTKLMHWVISALAFHECICHEILAVGRLLQQSWSKLIQHVLTGEGLAVMETFEKSSIKKSSHGNSEN